MARLESLNMLTEAGGKALLAEEYGKVIENIQKGTISALLKNKDLSGDPAAGSVEAKRFANTDSSAYGSARANGYGTKPVVRPVTIQLNIDREIINEVEEKDVKLFGVDSFVSRKAAANQKTMARELERAFFAEALNEGVIHTFGADLSELEKFESIVQGIETTSNAFVDGVERDMISVSLSPAEYGKIRSFLDTNTNNANVNSGIAEFGTLHGVRVYSSTYLPTGCTHIAMVDGAIAQPVLPTVDEPGKIQLSNAYHFGLFYSFGTKCVMPDLIRIAGDYNTALADLTVSSAAGTATGDTKITITEAPTTGLHYVYKVGTTVTVPALHGDVSSWTAWDGFSDITAQTGKKIAIVEANSFNRAVHGGSATVTAKS